MIQFLTGSEWGWPTKFFFLGVCPGAPGVTPRNVMASDISLLEIVHRRGSHFVVHLAPELKQEKHFCLKALCIWIPLPFYCHCHRQWRPPQMRKPGHSGLALSCHGTVLGLIPPSGELVFWTISHMCLIYFFPTLWHFFSPQPHTLNATSSSGIVFTFLLAP